MNKNKNGYTLIELVVVVLIIGILASIAVPQYLKTVETSKAANAAGVGSLLSNAYRMFRVDNPGAFLNGQISNACNSGVCDTSNPCRLVRCNYVAKQDWDAGAYNYTLTGGGVEVRRKTTGPIPPATNTPPYTSWMYTFSLGDGTCSTSLGTPSCPGF